MEARKECNDYQRYNLVQIWNLKQNPSTKMNSLFSYPLTHTHTHTNTHTHTHTYTHTHTHTHIHTHTHTYTYTHTHTHLHTHIHTCKHTLTLTHFLHIYRVFQKTFIRHVVPKCVRPIRKRNA